MSKISLLYPLGNQMCLMYYLYPILRSRHVEEFSFHSDVDELLKKDRNEILVCIRLKSMRSSGKTVADILKALRSKYRTLINFDDNDGTESYSLGYLPQFDLWFKRQAFRDRALYLKRFAGGRIYSDYYKNTFALEGDELNEPTGDAGQLDKIRIAWNLGVGNYPLLHRRWVAADTVNRLLGEKWARLLYRNDALRRSYAGRPKEPVCQARFSPAAYLPLVAFQRRHFLSLIEKEKSFLAGRIPARLYRKELRSVACVLSPYGWGEICFRDFEAIINGAVLVKPDMSHIETWPDVYIPEETYVPLRWDGSDLRERVAALLEQPAVRTRMAMNAFETYRAALSTASIDAAVERFVRTCRDA